MKIIRKLWKFLCLVGRGIKLFWCEYHFLVPISMWEKYYYETKRKIKRALNGLPILDPMNKLEYNIWLSKDKKEDVIQELDYTPLISIIIPVFNTPAIHLEQCIDSVLSQTYRNVEIYIIDNVSTDDETINCLKEYEGNKLCKILWCNQNIYNLKTNKDVVKIAKGEFVAFLGNDDILDKDALYENVKLLNKNKSYDIIYSDEDRIDYDGKFCEPHFKADFSPDTLMSFNYMCHFTIIRTEIFDKIDSFRKEMNEAEYYDLFLRLSEVTNNIGHIPKILYHWRKKEISMDCNLNTKLRTENMMVNILNQTLQRRKIKGYAKKDSKSGYYIIDYKYDREPSVSIIIPTRDCASLTNECLESIYDITDYSNYEIVLVDNNSETKESFLLFNEYLNKKSNFRVIKADMEFNYSKINNFAIKQCNSDIVVLLNNDTKVISPNWLKVMVSYAIQKHIGAVGPKLLYEDGTVQHGGVLLGLNTIASHAYINATREEIGIFGRLRVPYNYSAVTAACLAVERKKIIEVGYLNESLKVAYNDIEFNLRLRQHGYYNVFLPQIELYHLESKSRGLDTTKEKYEILKFEEQYMKNKYGEIIKNDPYYNPNYSRCDADANFYLDK